MRDELGRRALGTALSVVATVVALAALPSAAVARTTTCAGSANENGTPRADKKGFIQDYYVRNGSCPAARRLIRQLGTSDSGFTGFGRGGTAIARVQVPGGSVWKCRLGFVVNGKRRSLFDIEDIDPKQLKSFAVSGSCRALTGRLNRRVTLRSRNIRDQVVDESG